MWISPDGGKTWTQAQVTPGPDNTFQVYIINPTLADSPTDTVTLKVEAWDSEGNSVQQVITDAYRLVAPPYPAGTPGNALPL
jgi:hypothetical protein